LSKKGDNNREVRETDELVVYGKNAVMELLRSDKNIDTLYIDSKREDRQQSFMVSSAKEKGAVIKRVHPKKLEALCNNTGHQGVVALIPGIEYKELDEVLDKSFETKTAPLFVVCDGIYDPQNLGAIIRTAEVAGADAVIIPKRNSVGVNSTVFRASAGAASHIDVARVGNLPDTVRELKKRGIFCYAADMDGNLAYETDLTGPIALIVGSEGFGVSSLVLKLSDGVICLPMAGKTNSLNASVAAGALIYEIIRQRKYRKITT
jgi:23S rRNA (guanosine2251-2'-O)-methyltransferase